MIGFTLIVKRVQSGGFGSLHQFTPLPRAKCSSARLHLLWPGSHEGSSTCTGFGLFDSFALRSRRTASTVAFGSFLDNADVELDEFRNLTSSPEVEVVNFTGAKDRTETEMSKAQRHMPYWCARPAQLPNPHLTCSSILLA